MIPSGKNLFIWKIKHIANGDKDAILSEVKRMGLSGVSIKCTQRAEKFNLRWAGDRYLDDILLPLTQLLKRNGIRVYGWGWVEGDDPLGEATAAIGRIRQLDLDGWEIDAEGAYKGKPYSAEVYVNELRRVLGESYSIGLTSYRYPTVHPEFPWTQFCRRINYHIPQVYWNPPIPPGHGPQPELLRSIRELKAVKDIPIFPAGRAYIGDGHANPLPSELSTFMATALCQGLPGFTFWAFDHLSFQVGGKERSDAIANFVWTPSPPPDPIPFPIKLKTNGSVNIRSSPAFGDTDVGDLLATKITATEKNGEWYKVEGYIHQSVVTKV